MDAAQGVIIDVVGTLDNDGAVALNQHLHAVFDRRPSVVVIDLSAVPRCVSDGLAVLTGFLQRARAENVAVHLVHLGAPEAREWLGRSGLT